MVAIIALLVAILLPSLAGARERAKTLLCLNNLTHFGKASLVYAHDHKGYIPRDYYQTEYDTRDDLAHGLPHVLVPEVMSGYLGGPKYPLIPFSEDPHNATRDKRLAPVFLRMPVLRCPVFPRGGGPATDHLGRPITQQPYCYVANSFNFEKEKLNKQGSNQYFASQGVTLVSRIPTPGRLIYMTEANADSAWDNFGWHDFFRPEHLWWGADARMIDDYRHVGPGAKQPGRGVATALFFDGHAERMTFRQMTINRFTPNYTSLEIPLPKSAGG
ncbi:MAG: hypothetical protein AMXMBFR83_14770 [Phycisphaerae bacterium]